MYLGMFFFFLHSRSISWKPLASLFPPWPPRFDLDWLDDDGDDDEVDVEVADEVVDDDDAVEVLFAEVIDADDAGAVDGKWGAGPWLGTLKKSKTKSRYTFYKSFGWRTSSQCYQLY